MEPDLLKVCRICSIMDVKLHDLRSYPLDYYYESVIGTNPQYNNLPPYACYECAAMVRKFFFFRQKCLRSQAVLYGAKDSSGKIQSEKVKLIDRKSIHIASNLEIVSLPNIELGLGLDQKPETNVEVKLGSYDDVHDKIQFDHDYASLHSMDAGLSSDDDETMLLYVEKQSQNNESDDETVNLKEEYEGLEFVVGTEDPGSVIEVPTVLETNKKSQLKIGTVQRNGSSSGVIRKVATDRTCDDFAKYYDVIYLTLEEQKEEILKRKESSNYLNSPFKCNLCFKGFIDNNTWNHHVSKHAVTAGSIECEICKFRFRTKGLCNQHAVNHKQKYACKSCPFVTTFMSQAKQHQSMHKGITYVCKHCDEIFTIWTTYMSHVRIKHPSEFICGYCGYSFVNKFGLAMHKTKMHKDIQKKAEENLEEGLYCQECDVKFISEEAYKRHTIMSTKHTLTIDSIIGCRDCGATFENSEELRLHRRKEHSLNRPKNYRRWKGTKRAWPSKCDYCPEEIPNAMKYWSHFRRAHPDKKYPIQKNHICDVCGKTFTNNAFLGYHRRAHFGDRPFKCSHCDKAFTNSWKLTVHEKSHSDNRPYPCSVCFKAFKEKGALDRHFRIHTGQKPYECEICGKAFTQSNSKKLHVRTVHLKQPGPVKRKRLERRKQGPKQAPV